MEFRKTIKLESADQTALSFYAARKQLILMPVLIIALSLAAIMLINIGSKIDLFLVLITLITSIFFSGIIVAASAVSLKLNSKKQYQSSKPAQAPNEVLMDETGFYSSSEYGNSNLRWNDVFKAAESKSAYYIFIAKIQAFALPKRLIAPEEDAVIRTLIQNNLPPKKVKLIKRG